MTMFRATLATFACATALALSGTTAAAAATFSELQGISTEIKVTEDLPPAPKLAAPQSGPSVPHTAGKIMDRASTRLAQFATNGSVPPPAKQKPLKLK